MLLEKYIYRSVHLRAFSNQRVTQWTCTFFQSYICYHFFQFIFVYNLKKRVLDIKKHTERENSEHPDVKGIESCLDALKDVMAHINEDKRKTECQRQIFDIVYEVEGCPPTLVSSHRYVL